MLLGGGKDLVAMHGQQGLVGRDDMLAVGDGLHDQLLGHAIAADQFDDDVDLGIIDDGKGIIRHRHIATGDLLGQFDILVCHLNDANRPTGTPGNFSFIAGQDRKCAATDRADAKQTNMNGFHRISLN